jgi:hypothetical protein
MSFLWKLIIASVAMLVLGYIGEAFYLINHNHGFGVHFLVLLTSTSYGWLAGDVAKLANSWWQSSESKLNVG